jgi:hypothetical protein
LTVRGFKAVLDAMAGRFELARSDLAAARKGIAELGFQQASVWMAGFDAMAETLAGDAAAAERVLEDAERIAMDIGDRGQPGSGAARGKGGDGAGRLDRDVHVPRRRAPRPRRGRRPLPPAGGARGRRGRARAV